MTDPQHAMPHIDGFTAADLHARCEQVAVPDFDWVTQPLVAAAAGMARLLHIPDGQPAEPGK